MPRENNHGDVAGDKRVKVDWNDLFGAPEEEHLGRWNWGNVGPPGLLTDAMNEVNLHGDAISFATNRAHSAGSITLLHSGDKPRRWVNTYDEAEAFVAGLLEKYRSMPIP